MTNQNKFNHRIFLAKPLGIHLGMHKASGNVNLNSGILALEESSSGACLVSLFVYCFLRLKSIVVLTVSGHFTLCDGLAL